MGKRKKIRRRTRDVPVGIDEDGESVSLRLVAPRLHDIETINETMPEPVAPILKGNDGRAVHATDSEGNPVLDPATGHAISMKDFRDKAYLAACSRHEKAMTIALFMGCVHPPLVPKRTMDDYDHDPVAYYLGAWKELEDAGLDMGAFRALSSAAVELGQQMGKEDIVLARENLGISEGKKGEGK